MCAEHFTYITSVKNNLYSFPHLGDKNITRTQLKRFLDLSKVTYLACLRSRV